jgi:hypothetical protein
MNENFEHGVIFTHTKSVREDSADNPSVQSARIIFCCCAFAKTSKSRVVFCGFSSGYFSSARAVIFDKKIGVCGAAGARQSGQI